MKLHELVLKYLNEEGYRPIEEDFGIAFKCEGHNLLFIDEDDDKYLHLIIPGIYDITESNISKVMLAMNKVNSNIRYTKTYAPDTESVWIGFEIDVNPNSDIDDIINRGIRALIFTCSQFYKAILATDK